MSLMGTLAKVAIGVMVAKGASSLLGKAQRGRSRDDGLFGGTHAPQQQTQSDAGGIEDMLGGILGGSDQKGGGLGGLLEGLTGGRSGASSRTGGLDDLLGQLTKSGEQGGLGDLLGSFTGASGGSAGGLGGLLGGLAGAAGMGGKGGSFGDILNQSFERQGEPDIAPSPEQDAMAGLMLRAMIQAAKSDGRVDEAERAKLLDNLGEVSPEERAFVQQEMAAPVDVVELAHQVPQDMESQIYAMSVLAIDLDSRQEAEYLHALATEMSMTRDEIDHVHAQLGVPSIYN